MKVQRFEIQLQNSQPVYYAGQTIAGQVFLELAAELDMRSITMSVHGEANVRWSESHGSGKNRRTVSYTNNEVYLDIKLYFIGDGKTKMKLPAGNHTFPFSITLPGNLPSTFMGHHGRVMYYLKCNIDRPWKVDKTLHLYVTIISLLDLNYQPGASEQQKCQGTKKFGCLCCKTGPLSATIILPKMGFVCGETITFQANIENNSNKVMTKSSIRLVEHDLFKARGGRTRTAKRIVLQHHEASIAPGDSFTWSQVGLLIPPLPPSQLVHCNIIDVYYTVELVVDPSGIGFDLEVPVQIVIGTIPLRQTYQQIECLPGGSVEGNEPPPPSYGETVFGKEELDSSADGVRVQGGGWYAPQYPTYIFKT